MVTHWPGWKAWVAWILATSVGVVTSFSISYLVGLSLISETVWSELSRGQMNGAIGLTALVWALGMLLLTGPLVGSGQALVLRNMSGHKGWQTSAAWIAATTSGVVAGWSVLVVIRAIISPYIGYLTSGVLFGAAQWLALRRYSTAAVWWIPANGLAYLVSNLAGQTAQEVFLPQEWDGFIFYPIQSTIYLLTGWTIGVIVFGTITGLVLLYLLRVRKNALVTIVADPNRAAER